MVKRMEQDETSSECSADDPKLLTSKETVRTERRGLKRFQWGSVVLHSFPMILGDNPSVSSGPPVTMDWKATSHSTARVDNVEFIRKQSPSRSKSSLRLSKGDRSKILLRSGYTLSDILRESIAAETIQKSRETNLKKSGRFDTFRKVLIKATKSGVMERRSSAPRLFSKSPTAASNTAVETTSRVRRNSIAPQRSQSRRSLSTRDLFRIATLKQVAPA